MATHSTLDTKYLAYVAAINKRPFPGLKDHVHALVSLNDVTMTLPDFEKLLSDDIDAAPDMYFELSMLLCNEAKQQVGCRIEFRCTPKPGEFMGHMIHSKEKIKCMEHMFYQYRDGKIAEVWWMPGNFLSVEPGGIITKL